MDFIAQPGFKKLRAQVAADGDGDVMVCGAVEPECRELIAIEIELGIRRAGEPGIANITDDPDDAVSFCRNSTVRLTERDAMANGILGRKELVGQRLAEHHR